MTLEEIQAYAKERHCNVQFLDISPGFKPVNYLAGRFEIWIKKVPLGKKSGSWNRLSWSPILSEAIEEAWPKVKEIADDWALNRS